MILINESEIEDILDYSELVPLLYEGFQNSDVQAPERMHLSINSKNTVLIMPCWESKYYGIKHVFVCPENKSHGLPTITGFYKLFDRETGIELAQIDGPKLTAVRTVATSLLSTSFFISEIETMMIMGAGFIGEHLLKAYGTYFNPTRIIIWNRNMDKAKSLRAKYKNQFHILLSEELLLEFEECNVISCATHSKTPILKGDLIQTNVHIDLIGSYLPDHREADDALIQKCDIYIDSEKAMEESGDLKIPLESGTITKNKIKGDLFDLCIGKLIVDNPKISVFKSVGLAIEDLVTAIYLYEKVK